MKPSATPAPTAPAGASPPRPETPIATPTPAPVEVSPQTSASPAPSAAPQHQEGEVTWRVIPVPMEPGTETEPRVIRTAQGWAALFEKGTPAPEVPFEREMVILLPARLAIETVAASGDALLVSCHREQVDPDEGPASSSSVRLAVIVPVSDLPIRLVVR